MKSGNYEALINKFFAGKATAEEIDLLKSESLLNDQDFLYAEALKEEREMKMAWEFEDFIKEMPRAKLVPGPQRRIGLKRVIAAAAMILLVVTAYIFWPQTQTNETVKVAAVNKAGDSNPHLSANSGLPVEDLKDSQPLPVKSKTISKINKAFTIPAPPQNAVKKDLHPSAKEAPEGDTDLQNYLVVVNGKPITNEAEAMAITRESLGLISRNLTTTAEELKPIVGLKVKL